MRDLAQCAGHGIIGLATVLIEQGIFPHADSAGKNTIGNAKRTCHRYGFSGERSRTFGGIS